MNTIQAFTSPLFGEIRTYTENGCPFFCLADICRILDLPQVSRVKDRLNKDGVTTSKVIDRLGRTQEATFINESNLYKTIFQSRKPEAEQFTEWVTSEVLPSIRAHGKGMYAAADYTKGKDLRRVIDEMAHYQNLGGILRGEEYTMTETLTISPTARIIDEGNIEEEFIYRFTQNLKQQGYTTRQINDKIVAERWRQRDPGVLAALMGYDVIRSVPSPRRADYMVILNRTKLILLGGEK